MNKEFNEKARHFLRIKKLDGNDVHVVEGDNPKSISLLVKAYKGVYEPSFPMEKDRESLASWLDNLKSRDASVNITISILGENLDSSRPCIKAIAVGYYYSNHDVGSLAYLATAPEFRNRGLGHILNNANNYALLQSAANKGRKLRGIFLECNDPEKISPENDVMDPALRIRMYKKWGAIVLPIDYTQPPLSEGAAKCGTLKLLAYPHPETGAYPTLAAIKDYITGVYTELARYAGMPPQDNPDYIKTILQIDTMKPKHRHPKVQNTPF